MTDVLVWVLRFFGLLYLIAGLWMARQTWFWARMAPSMKHFAQALESFAAENNDPNEAAAELAETDSGRPWWLFAGAVILALAGAAMVAAHSGAVLLLALLIVHQLLYFVRQRRLELRAQSERAAAEARPERSTVNGFFALLLVSLLAAWLYHQDALA